MLKWLPVRCTSDVLHGSYWFLAGSILATIIPLITLISYFEHGNNNNNNNHHHYY